MGFREVNVAPRRHNRQRNVCLLGNPVWECWMETLGKKKCFNLENCVSGNKNMEGEHKIVVKVLPNLIPLCLNFSI